VAIGQPIFTGCVVSRDGAGVYVTLLNTRALAFSPGALGIAVFSAWEMKTLIGLFPVIILPLFFLKSRWSFLRAGPEVRNEVSVFGWTIRTRTHRLADADDASVERADSLLLQSPAWYRLDLWASDLGKRVPVARSNDQTALRTIAAALNDAIWEVRASGAS
jgi:hypothetical protein